MADEQQQVPMAPKQVIYPAAAFNVDRAPDGRRILSFMTGTEIVVFPMDENGARALAQQLTGVDIASPADLEVIKGGRS